MEKDVPEAITEDDGPFSYSYIAVMCVPGIRLDEADPEVHLFSFPELNASATLTRDWNRYCQHVDRSSAIALLLLTGFCGRSRFKMLSSWTNTLLRRLFGVAKVFERNLAREERSARAVRVKAHASPGCYLIYRADGTLVGPPQLHSARKIGRIGFGFDIVEGESYRSIHKSALHAVATSLALLMDKGTGSPEISKVADLVYLKGNSGLTIYPKKIEGGAASVVVSRLPSRDELHEVTQYIPLIAADHSIETAISLFVQSHRKDGDNLRAFIPAWSALELLVNRLTKVVRTDWEKLLRAAHLPNWDKNLSGVSLEDYRIRDRFYSVACTLKLEDADNDCKKFNRSNYHRSGYYHRSDVREQDLPTHDVRFLFRKYLALGLLYKMAKDDAN